MAVNRSSVARRPLEVKCPSRHSSAVECPSCGSSASCIDAVLVHDAVLVQAVEQREASPVSFVEGSFIRCSVVCPGCGHTWDSVMPVSIQQRLVVDIDGVLADHVPALLAEHNRNREVPISREEITDYHMLAGAVRVVYADERRIEEMPLIDENAPGVLAELIRLGCFVIIATTRPERLRKVTEHWLAKHRIPYHELCFTARKVSVRGDILIDDNPDEVLAWATARRTALLYSHPWNSGLICDRVRHVASWDQILDVLLDALMIDLRLV